MTTGKEVEKRTSIKVQAPVYALEKKAREVTIKETRSCTSTEWTDIEGASITMETGNNPIHIIWNATSAQIAGGPAGSAGRFHFRILLDGKLAAGSCDEFYNSGWSLRTITLHHLYTAAVPGTHEIKVQWKIDTGTEGRINWHEPASNFDETSQLIAIEL